MLIATTIRLFTGTFKALYADFDAFIRICWPWYALIAVLSLVAVLLVGGAQAPAIALPVALLWVVASSSIAVAWHRHLLLREALPPVNLRFGAREARYLLKMLQVLLVLLLPMIALGAAAGFVLALLAGGPSDGLAEGIAEGGPAVAGVAPIVVIGLALLALMPILMRISLVLPAAALDERLGLLEAWRESRGLGLPMTFATIGLGLVVGSLELVLRQAGGVLGEASFAGALALAILAIALQIATTALQIGVLTGGYYILRERGMAGGAGPGR